jgi:tetratricopeptide (TPR) repeat protein
MGKKSRGKLARATARPEAIANTTLPWTAREWQIVALLAALTFAVFGQLASHEFLNFDDGQFIIENGHVLAGLSGDSIAWALSSAQIGWYPLTWLSHMLDVALWNQRAGMHLLTNAALHAASTALLFAALRLLTRTTWPSAFVAALFAIHPMHVESVAWASERKDTLSTLFIMLALLFYARDPRRKLGVALAMAASLASKQMYVTFPAVLLLVDWWPLDRLRSIRELAQRAAEKLPLFVLSMIGCVIAVVGQRNLNALQSSEVVAFGQRFANAVVAYCRYLGKFFVPMNMALPYPYAPIGSGEAVAATLLLLAITAAGVAFRKRFPSLLMGWLWFAGVLVPVIGLVQIGAQSLADRYTYFAYIGLFLAITFAALASPIPRKTLAVIGAVAVVIYAAIAFRQVRFWRNSETLFAHTVAVTRDNAQAEYLLGQTLQMSDPDRALPHLHRAIDIIGDAANRGTRPPDWYTQSFVGIGTAELMKARALPLNSPERERLIRDADAQYRRALSIDPNAAHAKNNIAIAAQMLAIQQR